MKNLQLHAYIYPESGMFTAECVEIQNLVSQGRTEREAMANIKESVELFLESVPAKELAERMHTVAPMESFEVCAAS